MSRFSSGSFSALLMRACAWIVVGTIGWGVTPLAASATSATTGTLEVLGLDGSVAEPTVSEVTRGSLDSHFTVADYHATVGRGDPVWVKLALPAGTSSGEIPVLNVHTVVFRKIQIFERVAGRGASNPLTLATRLHEFAGGQDLVFILPGGDPGSGRNERANAAGGGTQSLYARIEPSDGGSPRERFSTSTLNVVLAQGAERARMITLAFGALTSMALAALLIWVVLSEKTFLLYGSLFFLQALYVGYFSGQAFEWPILAYALPLTHYAWNVPSALSGAAACLFVREIADLHRFSPRVYSIFGWLAAAFVLLTFANLAKLLGFGALVNNIGNILILGSALFTLVVAFTAWKRGSRAAGWFLFAWVLLEAFVIATTVRLLFNSSDEYDRVIYYGLPLSMVSAAVLIALGLADRLREQRLALTDAERRAQTDSLTGVLNRRSLIERLDAACIRARARGLPISLLFIDLDHFKEINDSFGHPAGDACLAAIIAPMQAELRQSDVIGRYGGEEFVVILSSADAAAAHPIAQRILERVASVRVEGFGVPIGLTCSIGVATSDMLGVWGEKLIAQADAAVYAAKRSGRNRVQLATPLAA